MNEFERRIKKQLDLLITEYDHAKKQSEARNILYSIKTIIQLQEMFDNDISLKTIRKRNTFYLQKEIENESRSYDLYVNDFEKNKKFHEKFIEDIVKKFDFFEHDYDGLKLKNFTELEKQELINNFSKKTQLPFDKIYNDLKTDNRIIVVPDFKKGYSGITILDIYNNCPFIIINSLKEDIFSITTLVHEIAHIMDASDKKGNELYHYDYSTIAREVNSLYLEKKFLNYCYNNNIQKENIVDEILLEPENILDNMLSFLVYCNSTKRENIYNRIKINEKLEKILLDCNLEYEINDGYIDDFYSSTCYLYGEILSIYFLEHPEKYNEFRQKRCCKFDPNLFISLDITSDEIVKSLYKRYDKYIK